jgi:hypothetical protein
MVARYLTLREHYITITTTSNDEFVTIQCPPLPT